MKSLIEDLLRNNLKEREVLIIKKRFGLEEDEEPYSLEAIGKNLGITRERVRQIQNNALQKIKKAINDNPKIKDFIKEVKSLLEPLGVREERNFYKLLIEKKIVREREINYLKFIFINHQEIHYHPEDKDLNSFYAKSEDWAFFFRHLLKKIAIYFLENNKEIFEENKIFEIIAKELKAHLADLELQDYYEILRILKPVYKNPFGKWGFITNHFVVPSSLKEKILTILKIEGKPLHFTEIYNKISQVSEISDEFVHPAWKKKYSLDSIKNELIRHPEFVLVGRGIYGLKEWGFKEGTAFELLKEFLASKKEVDFKELIEFFKNQRFIKLTTLNIYLYRLLKSRFIKFEEGKIKVVKNA